MVYPFLFSLIEYIVLPRRLFIAREDKTDYLRGMCSIFRTLYHALEAVGVSTFRSSRRSRRIEV